MDSEEDDRFDVNGARKSDYSDNHSNNKSE